MTPPLGTLLIVDDEEDMVLVLNMFAKQALPDVTIKTATSGAEALAVMATEPVDVILCDYRMPIMDGVECLQRSLKVAPNAHRILMSALADSSLATKAAERVPLHGFFMKAAAPAKLRQQLQEIFLKAKITGSAS